MMAYMSDAGGPQAGDASDIRLDAFDADKGANVFEYYPQWCSRMALREAERILAETEADGCLTDHGPMQCGACWDEHDAHGPCRIHCGCHDGWESVREDAHADLAADLATILPVLDELAADAQADAAQATGTFAHFGMGARNRATLAAMDAR